MSAIQEVNKRYEELTRIKSTKGLNYQQGKEYQQLGNIKFKYKTDPEFKKGFNKQNPDYAKEQLSKEYDINEATKILNNPEGSTAGQTLEAVRTLTATGQPVTLKTSTPTKRRITEEEQSTPPNNSENNFPTFYAPRTTNPQETIQVNNPITGLPQVQAVKKSSGTINARRPGDLTGTYENAPTTIDITESKAVGYITESNALMPLKNIGSGIITGVFTQPKMIYQTIKDPQGTAQKIKQSSIEIGKDPVNKLIYEPIELITKNPTYELSKLATETAILTAELKVLSPAIKKAGETIKEKQPTGYDIKAGTLETSPQIIRETEKEAIYKQSLKREGISPQTETFDIIPYSGYANRLESRSRQTNLQTGLEISPLKFNSDSKIVDINTYPGTYAKPRPVYDELGNNIGTESIEINPLKKDKGIYEEIGNTGQKKLTEDTIIYKIKNNEYVPFETDSATSSLQRAQSEKIYHEAVFDLKLSKKSIKSTDANFIYQNTANSKDLAILGQRTLKGNPISDSKIKELNAPLYENELIGAPRKENGFIIYPEEKIILKRNKENLIQPTGQKKLTEDELIIGNLEDSKRITADVIDGMVFGEGKEFNPQKQTIVTINKNPINQPREIYDIDLEIGKIPDADSSKQINLFGKSIVKEKEIVTIKNSDIRNTLKELYGNSKQKNSAPLSREVFNNDEGLDVVQVKEKAETTNTINNLKNDNFDIEVVQVKEKPENTQIDIGDIAINPQQSTTKVFTPRIEELTNTITKQSKEKIVPALDALNIQNKETRFETRTTPTLELKQKNIPQLDITEIQDTKLETQSRKAFDITNTQKTSTSTKSALTEALDIATGQDIIQEQTNIQEQQKKQSTKSRRYESPLKETFEGKTRRTITTPTIEKKPKTKGVNLYIKREGKFKLEGTNLNPQEAFNLGKIKTGGSSARTFKLEGDTTDITEDTTQYKKKPGNIFIEKSKYAINTQGEKEEITFKGIQKNKGIKI